MYQYNYVPVEYKLGITKITIEEHRDTIDEYAKNGWRFVAAIPTRVSGHGVTMILDLVFEKAK